MQPARSPELQVERQNRVVQNVIYVGTTNAETVMISDHVCHSQMASGANEVWNRSHYQELMRPIVENVGGSGMGILMPTMKNETILSRTRFFQTPHQ